MWNLRLPARILVMNSEHVPEASYRRVSHVNANSKYKLHRFVVFPGSSQLLLAASKRATFIRNKAFEVCCHIGTGHCCDTQALGS